MKASVWKKIRSFLVDWGKPVVFGLLLAFLCSQFFRIAVVEGDSMEPTLQDGQVLLLQTGFLKEENLKRGDIIVASKKIPEKTQIIKRVIGLPGEHLEILDNEVYINGEKLEENYLDEPMKTKIWMCTYQKASCLSWVITGMYLRTAAWKPLGWWM